MTPFISRQGHILYTQFSYNLCIVKTALGKVTRPVGNNLPWMMIVPKSADVLLCQCPTGHFREPSLLATRLHINIVSRCNGKTCLSRVATATRLNSSSQQPQKECLSLSRKGVNEWEMIYQQHSLLHYAIIANNNNAMRLQVHISISLTRSFTTSSSSAEDDDCQLGNGTFLQRNLSDQQQSREEDATIEWHTIAETALELVLSTLLR